jgi:hypothetical protein
VDLLTFAALLTPAGQAALVDAAALDPTALVRQLRLSGAEDRLLFLAGCGAAVCPDRPTGGAGPQPAPYE